jgi:DNA polymerase-1
LDCAVTQEVGGKIRQTLDPVTARIYAFESALQGPALTMMMRGVLVDDPARAKLAYDLLCSIYKIRAWIDTIGLTLWEKPINPRSHVQLKALFYEHMGLPRQYINVKGERKLSCGREALEKLKSFHYATPLVIAILKIRDLEKSLQVLQSGIDQDGRMRSSYNIAATETGRWSSSKNCFGTGTNFQNIADPMRRIFKSDPGYKLCYADLSGAESYCVGFLSGDRNYIEACQSGDVHTHVCRMVWPELPWTSDPKHNRELADQPFYREYSYRFMAKKGGHASNYMATAFTIARHLKISQSSADDFQDLYFGAFPGIRRRHHAVARQIQSHGTITSHFGRRRRFFGRLSDDAVIREAIAFEPQSIVVDLVNLALLRIWQKYDVTRRIQLLGQVHDAILFQYREGDEAVVPLILAEMEIPLEFGADIMIIPADAEVGYCWDHESLAPFGSPKASAQIRPNTPHFLDWEISGFSTNRQLDSGLS